MSWLQRNRDLIALACAGICLLVLEFGLRMPPIPALGISLAVWVAIWLSFAPKRRHDLRAAERVGAGTNSPHTSADGHPSAAIMEEVRRTLNALEQLRDDIKPLGPSVGSALSAILRDAQAMFKEAESQPSEFRHDRRALLHYLPQVQALLERSLEGGAVQDLAARQRLEATCHRLAELFASFRRRKAERQTRALNVQIDVLEAQLRQEGLAPPKDERPTSR